MTNSRQKGARGEREAAAYLRKLGFDASRNGRNGYISDDLIVSGLPNVHIEVKFGVVGMDIGTRLLYLAWEQAESSVADKSWSECHAAVVLWKPTRKPWRLTWMDRCGLVTTTGDDAIKTKLLELNSENQRVEPVCEKADG